MEPEVKCFAGTTEVQRLGRWANPSNPEGVLRTIAPESRRKMSDLKPLLVDYIFTDFTEKQVQNGTCLMIVSQDTGTECHCPAVSGENQQQRTGGRGGGSSGGTSGSG